MNLFYITGTGNGDTYTLDPEESRHAVKVLRLKMGDTIYLTDGKGVLYTGRVADHDPRRCTVLITGKESVECERSYRLTMAVAPTKNHDRYEWFLEKATEIGCNRFVPVITEHSERRVFKEERAGKVILSAAKQSLKLWLPELDPPVSFDEIVSRPFAGTKLIAHCADGEKQKISEAIPKGGDVLILIGPEGDFSGKEILTALDNGFLAISLGDSRLRTETAAVMSVAAAALANL